MFYFAGSVRQRKAEEHPKTTGVNGLKQFNSYKHILPSDKEEEEIPEHKMESYKDGI